jgi:hypothetical protein
MMNHWRTTLTGFLTGAAYAALGVYQHNMTLKQWALAAGVAVLGYLSADAAKSPTVNTGGTAPKA